ncbi:MAG: hypothetical protein A2Y94_08740 [Caldithrix sp. RBG_13_44_9]|nr:MAG: hypothetical protein A2Y94_08740 [Caldithrix sp. RBG_13_44_9]
MIIKEFLKDLTQIRNVEAISIYGIDNILIDSWTLPSINIKTVTDISFHYFQIFSVLDSKGQNFKEIVISHENGHIYARILPDLLFIVLVKSIADITLIRLIINVKITDLLNSRTFQKIRKNHSGKHLNFLDRKFLDDSEREYIKNLEI